jgi:indole-3-pyruvate monooxygenase
MARPPTAGRARAAVAMTSTPTIVVGAGPAGLAVAGLLRQRGRDFTLIEAGPRIANSWRHHYDRLHLHTPKQTSQLPGFPFPAGTPTFPSRQQVVDYLDSYAERFGIKPRFDERMTLAKHVDGRWLVTTDREQFSAKNLVITTGLLRVPHRPELPGQGDFGRAMSHACTYANPTPFVGKRVLVVGFGNSGAEIAFDLVEHGVEVGIVVSRPCNVVPRSLMKIPAGIPSAVFIWMARTLPRSWQDAFLRTAAKRALGELETYGIRAPSYGVVAGLARGHAPLVDIGTIGAIKTGRIAVYPAIERLTATGAIFKDGRCADFDHVLLATGYRTGLEDILADADVVLDAAGVPKTIGRESELRGLYFVGFEVRALGLLFTTMLDARAVVDRLAA